MMTVYITYIFFPEKKTLCIHSFCNFIRLRLSFCSIPAMTMWARWEKRFKMFGATRVNLLRLQGVETKPIQTTLSLALNACYSL